MSHVYNMHEAKTNLSKLVKLAESGARVTIARAGKPGFELTLVKAKPRPKLGEFEPLDIRILQDFDSSNQDWIDALETPDPELVEIWNQAANAKPAT